MPPRTASGSQHSSRPGRQSAASSARARNAVAAARARPPRRPEALATFLNRLWSLPLVAHAGALVVLVVALAPFMRVDGSGWVDDEGYYALQVQALEDGSWEYEYRGAEFDPDASHFGLFRSERGDERGVVYPYVKHPGYVLALRAAVATIGERWGYHALSMAGLILAAVVAWLLAREMEPRAARPAFWLVALSPLLVNAYVIWAHTLSAALAGLGFAAAVRIVRRGLTPLNALGLALALSAGVLARTEAILFGVALIAGLVVLLAWHRRLRLASAVVTLGAGSTLITMVLELRWIESIVGDPQALPGSRASTAGASLGELLDNRLAALWRVVFDAGQVDRSLETNVLAALVVALIAGLALRLRRTTEGQRVGVGLAGCAAVVFLFLYGTRFKWNPFNPVSGFFAAWPVLLLALAALPWRSMRAVEWLVVGVSVLFALTVFATQYDVGGGGEWGGRFLSPVVIPLAVVAAVGLVRRLDGRAWLQRWTATAGVALVAMYPAGYSLDTIHRARSILDGAIEEFVATESAVAVTGEGLWSRLPSWAWRHDRDVVWMIGRRGRLPSLLQSLADAGVDDVTIMVPGGQGLPDSPFHSVDDVTGPITRGLGWKLVRLRT